MRISRRAIITRIFISIAFLSCTHRTACAVSCEDLFAEWLLSDGADGALIDIFSLLSMCEGEVLCHVCHAGASGVTALICQLNRFFAVANMCCEDGLRAVMAEEVPFVKAKLQPNANRYFRSSMPSTACFHCWSTVISRFDVFTVTMEFTAAHLIFAREGGAQHQPRDCKRSLQHGV